MNKDWSNLLWIVIGMLTIATILTIFNILIQRNQSLQKTEIKEQTNVKTGCVIVAEVSDCKIYNCTYKSTMNEHMYIIKEVIVCQTSNACITVIERRHPP